jgi:hypothetical protein
VTAPLAQIGITFVLALGWSHEARADAVSVYTSIRPADCQTPPAEVSAPYEARHLGVQQCPAPRQWTLLLVSSDANTWIDLAGPDVTWSGERPVVYDSPIGNFPSVGGSSAVEWRRWNGRLTALIFRVTAQDPAAFDKHRSVLYVVRLQRDGACVLGRADTNEGARRLADAARGC